MVFVDVYLFEVLPKNAFMFYHDENLMISLNFAFILFAYIVLVSWYYQFLIVFEYMT